MIRSVFPEDLSTPPGTRGDVGDIGEPDSEPLEDAAALGKTLLEAGQTWLTAGATRLRIRAERRLVELTARIALGLIALVTAILAVHQVIQGAISGLVFAQLPTWLSQLLVGAVTLGVLLLIAGRSVRRRAGRWSAALATETTSPDSTEGDDR